MIDLFGTMIPRKFNEKSGYKALMHVKRLSSTSGSNGNRKWWSFLWNLHVPNKVKLFLWKVFHEIIPTVTNLNKKGTPCLEECKRCKYPSKSTSHALFLRGMANSWWELSVWGEIIRANCHLSISDMLTSLKSKQGWL